MDVNRDGVVTLDEFLQCCHNDEAISRSMAVFDTAIWPCDSPVGDIKTNKLNYKTNPSYKNNKNSLNKYKNSNGSPTENKNHSNVQNYRNKNISHTYHHYQDPSIINNSYHSSIATNSPQPPPPPPPPPPPYVTHNEIDEKRLHHQTIEINENDEDVSSDNTYAQRQIEDSPSLVKVKTWYTVAKQGVSC